MVPGSSRLWVYFNLANQSGTFWFTEADGDHVLPNDDFIGSSKTLPEPSFYKVSITILRAEGQSYQVNYCEAEGTICKVENRSHHVLIGIGIGAFALLVVVVSAVVSRVYCKKKTKALPAQTQESIPLEGFEPYDEILGENENNLQGIQKRLKIAERKCTYCLAITMALSLAFVTNDPLFHLSLGRQF